MKISGRGSEKLFSAVFLLLFVVSVSGLTTVTPESFADSQELVFNLSSDSNDTYGGNVTVEVGGENHTADWNDGYFVTEQIFLGIGDHQAVYYKSPENGSESYNFTVDTSDPGVNITSPTEKVFQDDFEVKGGWTDANLLDGNLSFNGKTVETGFTVNVSNYSEGEYRVKVEAVDKAGNRGEMSRTVYIDKTEPEFNGLDHDGENVSETVIKNGDVLKVQAEDEGSKIKKILYKWSSEDDWSSSENKKIEADVSEGVRDISFRIMDLAGHWKNDSTVYSVEVDNTPPEVVFEGFETNWRKEAELSVNCTEAEADAALYDSEGRVAGWDSYVDFRLDSHGTHEMSPRCRDSAGNVNDTVEREIKIDRRSPNIDPETENKTVFDSFRTTLEFNVDDSGSGFNSSAVSESFVNVTVEDESWDTESGELTYDLKGVWPESSFSMNLNVKDRTGWEESAYYKFYGGSGYEVPIKDRTRKVEKSIDGTARVKVEESRKDILNLSFQDSIMIDSVSMNIHSVSGNASITVEELGEENLSETAPGEIYSYVDIEPENFSYGANTSVEFSVDKDWIEEVNHSENRLQVYHRKGKTWRNVSFNVVEDSPTELVVQTRVNSFSVFAVGFEGSASTFTVVVAEVTDFGNWLTLFFLFGVIFSIWYLLRSLDWRPGFSL